MPDAIVTRPLGGQQGASHWKSAKRQRTLSLSDAAWELASELAMGSGSNRSEVVEILLREATRKQLDLVTIRSELVESA